MVYKAGVWRWSVKAWWGWCVSVKCVCVLGSTIFWSSYYRSPKVEPLYFFSFHCLEPLLARCFPFILSTAVEFQNAVYWIFDVMFLTPVILLCLRIQAQTLNNMLTKLQKGRKKEFISMRSLDTFWAENENSYVVECGLHDRFSKSEWNPGP